MDAIDSVLENCTLDEIIIIKNKVDAVELRLKLKQDAMNLRLVLEKDGVFYKKAHKVPITELQDIQLVNFYIPLKSIDPHEYYYYSLYDYEGQVFDVDEFVLDKTGLSLFVDFDEIVKSKETNLIDMYRNNGYPYIFGYNVNFICPISKCGFYFDVETQKVVMANKKYNNKYDLYECYISFSIGSDDDEDYDLEATPNFKFIGRQFTTSKYVYLGKLGSSKYKVVINS